MYTNFSDIAGLFAIKPGDFMLLNYFGASNGGNNGGRLSLCLRLRPSPADRRALKTIDQLMYAMIRD
jgi:hypothetical protein